jgi:hypothetical protein
MSTPETHRTHNPFSLSNLQANFRCNRGGNALNGASYHGYVRVCRMLVESGIDVTATWCVDAAAGGGTL